MRNRLRVVLLMTLICAGCARVGALIGPPRGEGDESEQFFAAVEAMERGEDQIAALALRSLAGRCESRAYGRQAILTLAALELDPRGGTPSPAAGAQLSARYLQIPSAPPGSLSIAESLYLLALDLGARPVDDPFAPVPISSPGHHSEAPHGSVETELWRVADRFQDCSRRGSPTLIRPLPVHPSLPLWAALEGIWEERNALASVTDSLRPVVDSLSGALARYEQMADSLQAEITRIRELLGQGGGPLANQSGPQ